MSAPVENETLCQKPDTTTKNGEQLGLTIVFDCTEDGFPVKPGAVHDVTKIIFGELAD